MKSNIIHVEPKKLVNHNHTRIDKYFWMQDIKNRKVLSYLKNENNICENELVNSKCIQDNIYNEIIKKIDIEYKSIPFFKKKYGYFYKIEKSRPYPIYCRIKKNKKNKGTFCKIILDVNKIIESGKYGNVTNIQISPCEEYLLYCLDTTGNRKYQLHIKNIEKNTSSLVKKNITDNVIWGRNDNEIFFSDMDKKTLRQNQVYKYNIKNNRKILMYEEFDDEFYTCISKSKSRRFLFIISSGKQCTEYRYIDLFKSYLKIKVIRKREFKIKYYVEHINEHFYLKMNDKAKNFKICKIKIKDTNKFYEKVEELIKELPNVFINDFDIFENYVAIIVNRDNKKILNIFDITNNKISDEIEFKDEFYELDFYNNTNIEDKKLTFTFTTLNTPEEIYEYDFIKKNINLIKTTNIPNSFPPLTCAMIYMKFLSTILKILLEKFKFTLEP